MAVGTLMVGNLSPQVTEDDLRHLFEAYGKIRSLRFIARRGMAFVEQDLTSAEAAVDALRGTQLKGRTLDVVLERSAGRPRGRPPRRSGRR